MILQVNLSEEEGNKIKELAKKEDRSISNFCMKILLDKLKELEDAAGK